MQSARLAHKTLSIDKLEEKKRVYVYNESEASLTHIFIKFTLFIIKYFVYCKLPLFIMLYIYFTLEYYSLQLSGNVTTRECVWNYG